MLAFSCNRYHHHFLSTSIVSALGHGLDVPKQITLSDHCFGFKLVHNFHRPDALPGVKPPFRPWGNCCTPGFPQQRIWLTSKNHCHDETKEQRGRISPVLGVWKSITIAFYDMHRCSGSILCSPIPQGTDACIS